MAGSVNRMYRMFVSPDDLDIGIAAAAAAAQAGAQEWPDDCRLGRISLLESRPWGAPARRYGSFSTDLKNAPCIVGV